jgi:hypothetical protein
VCLKYQTCSSHGTLGVTYTYMDEIHWYWSCCVHHHQSIFYNQRTWDWCSDCLLPMVAKVLSYNSTKELHSCILYSFSTCSESTYRVSGSFLGAGYIMVTKKTIMKYTCCFVF